MRKDFARAPCLVPHAEAGFAEARGVWVEGLGAVLALWWQGEHREDERLCEGILPHAGVGQLTKPEVASERTSLLVVQPRIIGCAESAVGELEPSAA